MAASLGILIDHLGPISALVALERSGLLQEALGLFPRAIQTFLFSDWPSIKHCRDVIDLSKLFQR